LDLNPGLMEAVVAVLLVDLIIIVFIIFTISLFYLFVRILRMFFGLISPKFKVDSIFSIIAYSTFCAYLFHRIFLIIYTYILTEGLDINTFNRDNMYLEYLFVPFIFLFSYFIQKGYDLIVNKLTHKTRISIESEEILE
jgi:hypothetical protein